MDIGEFFRAATRPAVTVIFAAVIAQVVVEQIPIPEAIWAILVVPILWWFGQRTVERLKTNGRELSSLEHVGKLLEIFTPGEIKKLAETVKDKEVK